MISPEKALRLGSAAATAWGSLAAPPRILNIRENIVLDVAFTDGRRGALRLHRPGYQSRDGILAELDWTERLADRGFQVPRPIATRAGGLTGSVDDRITSLVSWIDGQPIGVAGVPLAGGQAEQVADFRALGTLIAALHRETDALSFDRPPARPAWDIEGLLGADPWWGRFWENPALTDADGRLLFAARDKARARLHQMLGQDADYGLIHADLMRENVLRTAAGLALIDFDDSGYGFRLYDLGTALVQNLEEPMFPALARALAEGYGAGRGGPAPDALDLTLFTMLRAFASAGWIMTRAAADDPRHQYYADRAVRLAGDFLADRPLWGGR